MHPPPPNTHTLLHTHPSFPTPQHQFIEPPAPKGPNPKELLDQHAARVRDQLLCEDYKGPVGAAGFSKSCAQHQKEALAPGGDANWCQTHKADVVFHCPHTCGFCDVVDNQFCEDFYLMKCRDGGSIMMFFTSGILQCVIALSPSFSLSLTLLLPIPLPLAPRLCSLMRFESRLHLNLSYVCASCTGPKWMEQGKCGTQDRVYGAFNDVCRKSCGVCHSKADVVVVAQDEYHGEELPRGEIRPERGTHNPPVLPTGEEPVDPIQQQLHGPMTVDPTLLHREYLEGNVPDKPTGGDQCQLKGKPEGNMLSRIPVADMEGPTHKAHGSYLDSNGKPLRIFCGIYTMEKNHGTNVEATRSTWAKRCDGFIAFSTVEDPKIPSVNILHEGDEAYDNMWQKSRSIWRYIHNHMADDYDFFLLGGDDMFYIIENLRAYLGSEEITRAREEQSGKQYMQSRADLGKGMQYRPIYRDSRFTDSTCFYFVLNLFYRFPPPYTTIITTTTTTTTATTATTSHNCLILHRQACISGASSSLRNSWCSTAVELAICWTARRSRCWGETSTAPSASRTSGDSGKM